MLLKVNVVSEKCISLYKTKVTICEDNSFIETFIKQLELDSGFLAGDEEEFNVNEVLFGPDWSNLTCMENKILNSVTLSEVKKDLAPEKLLHMKIILSPAAPCQRQIPNQDSTNDGPPQKTLMDFAYIKTYWPRFKCTELQNRLSTYYDTYKNDCEKSQNLIDEILESTPSNGKTVMIIAFKKFQVVSQIKILSNLTIL